MFNLLKNTITGFINKVNKITEEKSDQIKLSSETKIKGILSSTIVLSDQDVDNILSDFQMSMIQADVAVETTDYISGELREELSGKEIERDKIGSFVKMTMRNVIEDTLTTDRDTNFLQDIKNLKKPVKIVFFGINGTGKTTTIAKVAKFLMNNNFSVVLAAGDTFRAGAIEQLEKHANNLNINMIKHQKGADATAVIYDAVQHAIAKNIDVVLADTAGRMQTNRNLMDEMQKICRVIKPDLKIFVGDALTGNDALEQCREFNNKIGIDAIILAKMDADAKGGSAISIVHETKKSIILIGTGQNYEDLKEFDKDWFIRNII